MSRYLTQPELLDRRRREQLLRLAKADAGGLDDERVAQAIADAEAEVTSWLAPRYGGDLPDAPAAAGEQLKRLVADLVPYHLSKGSAAIPDQVLDEYDRTVRFLRAIAQGTAVLDLPAKPKTDSSTPIARALRPASDAALTLDTLKGW